jgi:hypothetical protein
MSGSKAVGRIGLNGLFAGIPKTASQTSGTDPGTNAVTGMPMRATIAPARRKASHRLSPRGLVRKCQAIGACLPSGAEVYEAGANRCGDRAPFPAAPQLLENALMQVQIACGQSSCGDVGRRAAVDATGPLSYHVYAEIKRSR